MIISETDRVSIKQHAKFLEEKGYKIVWDDSHSIAFSNESVEFDVCYEPYGDTADVSVKFQQPRTIYSLDWITKERDSVRPLSSKSTPLERVLYFLKYIETHYDQISDFFFCSESMVIAYEQRAKSQDNSHKR